MIIIERLKEQGKWKVTIRSARKEVFTVKASRPRGKGRVETKKSGKHHNSNIKRFLRYILGNYKPEYSLVTSGSFLD